MQSNRLRQVDEALKKAATRLSETSLHSLMHGSARSRFIHQFEDLTVDWTRQQIDDESLNELFDLAEESNLRERIDDLFSGVPINTTENQPVQHLRLRRPGYQSTSEYQKLAEFADKVRRNPNITSIVNIGIGGSDLGPKMLTGALAGYCDGPVCYFVGNICPTNLNDVLVKCDPNKTLFIITSKSFKTSETLANAKLAKQWLARHDADVCSAMIAVTSAGLKAVEWGIDPSRVYTFAHGIGGRYSLWSSVGLSVMISIGTNNFAKILAGGHAIDCHVQQAEWHQNIGVIMGLLRVWHRNYLQRPAYGLIPYDQRLEQLPVWVQQLEMESNGKSVDRHGHKLKWPAGPIIWGAPGTSAQHSFFQWLHQSVDVIPIDILVAMQPAVGLEDLDWQNSHKNLAINAVAQAEALAVGSVNDAEPHRNLSGNRPSVLITWEKTTPYALGRLLALYEHITVISGFIWGVNSFDQWGVELGKKMASQLQAGVGLDSFSPAAHAFLDRLNAEYEED